MKKWIVILLLLCGVGLSARAEDAPPTNLWFAVGETLTYRISWGVIPVATSLVTTEWAEENGKKVIVIRFRTRSNDFLSKLYPVNDFLEAVIDPVTFLPCRFTKKLSEGRYKTEEVTTFDHANKKAVWTKPAENKSKEIEIDADTRDLITFMYFMRSKRFEPLATTRYRVMADEKVYDLTVKTEGIESFRVGNFGWVPCLKCEPEAQFGGLFVRKGRMWMWVSQDQRQIATKISAKVPVASITLLLSEVGGPGDDTWVKVTQQEQRMNSGKAE